MTPYADSLEYIENVCRSPRGYTLNGTFGEVAALLTGTIIDSGAPDERDAVYQVFNHFVTSHLLVPSKFWWADAINMVSSDDNDAIGRLKNLITDFLTMRTKSTLDEIRQESDGCVASYQETEPARIWRKFMAARFNGDREDIERLILPNTDAPILWERGGAPPGIAEQLISLTDCNIVSVLAGSVESGYVQLITELGKIDAHLVNGEWRIDAKPFIAIERLKREMNELG